MTRVWNNLPQVHKIGNGHLYLSGTLCCLFFDLRLLITPWFLQAFLGRNIWILNTTINVVISTWFPLRCMIIFFNEHERFIEYSSFQCRSRVFKCRWLYFFQDNAHLLLLLLSSNSYSYTYKGWFLLICFYAIQAVFFYFIAAI
jgi:hypothetical protein